MLSEQLRRERLAPAEGQLRVVLDTDTYNEVDDQFAVVHALLSPERIRLLDRLGVKDRDRVFKGSERCLPSSSEPVPSAAAEHLIELPKTGDGPLYVAAIGAITNVASAILLDPSIIERIVVLWLGGSNRTGRRHASSS